MWNVSYRTDKTGADCTSEWTKGGGAWSPRCRAPSAPPTPSTHCDSTGAQKAALGSGPGAATSQLSDSGTVNLSEPRFPRLQNGLEEVYLK